LNEIATEGLWNRSDNIHWVKAVAVSLVNYWPQGGTVLKLCQSEAPYFGLYLSSDPQLKHNASKTGFNFFPWC